MIRISTIWIMAAILWSCGLLSWGQVNSSGNMREQLSGQQVSQVFDFEERTVNFQKLPMYWNKVEAGREYPHYTEGMLDRAHTRSGQYSFKFVPNGGSMAYEYDRRKILVKPGGDSQVMGYVYFSRAERCRAQLRCVLTDRMGRPIDNSERRSALVGEQDTDDSGWARMEVYVPGNFSEARYISVSLWFMQEEQWNRDGGLSHVYQKNVWAEAWFDDIAIYQLPRVVLKTTHSNNLFNRDETPRVEVEVQGVGTLDYQAQLILQNGRGDILHNEQWVLTGLEGEVKIRPFEFSGLPAGIYKANLNIYSNGKKIAGRRVSFGVLARLYGDADQSGQGFGVVSLGPDAGSLDVTIDMLRTLQARMLKLPVWRRHNELSGTIAMDPDFDKKLLDLLRRRTKIVAVFDEVTDDMAAQMITPNGTILDMFQQDAGLWQNQLSVLLSQYARQIIYWQTGQDNNQMRLDSRIGRTIETIRPAFNRLVGDTVLIAPVTATQLVHPDQIKSKHISVFVPRAVAPEQISNYVQEFVDQGYVDIWLVLDWFDDLDRERDFALIDLARRLAYARRSGASAVFIDHPWKERIDSAAKLIEPTEGYLVFRTMADLLGGSTYCDEISLSRQVHGLIFDNHGVGYLVVWNKNFDPYGENDPAQINLYLGDNPQRIDIFGNVVPMEKTDTQTQLVLNQWPAIISGVHVPIAKLRSSMHLEPNVVEADVSRQEMDVVFTNPWPDTIAGSIRFYSPENRVSRRGWEISPQTMNYVLRSGETFRRQITIKFPSAELGGSKKLKTQMLINADRNYNIDVFMPFEIQLQGVNVSTFAQRLGSRGIRIQQIVSNEADQPLSMRSFMDLPNLEHQELPITELAPGQATTKVYLVPDALQWYGMSIRVGLYDPEGTRRINFSVPIK